VERLRRAADRHGGLNFIECRKEMHWEDIPMTKDAPTPKDRNLDVVGKITRKFRNARYRRQLTGFEFAFADRIEFLNADHWDLVTAEASVFLTRAFLKAVQQATPNGMILRFALIYRNGQPVSAVATQTFDIDGSQLVQSVEELSKEDRMQFAVRKLSGKALGAVRRRVMVCGNVAAWGPHGVAFRPKENAQELWPGVAEALYRMRRSDKLHGQVDYVLVKDLSVGLSQMAAPLEQFSYRSFETEPDMQLTLPPKWRCFDDYLGGLNKKYRKAVNEVGRELESAGVIVRTLATLDDHVLHELYHAVARRAQVRLAELPAGYFSALANSLGDDRFVVLAAEQADRMIGFVSVIRDGQTAVGYYLGLDYEANAKLPVYHRLLYAVIEQSIRWGCSQISFGRTALDAKARLGCQPVPTFVWVRHRVPMLNLIVRQLLKVVPHDEPPERNPLRNE
jgi:predicted N-acyltransferase